MRNERKQKIQSLYLPFAHRTFECVSICDLDFEKCMTFDELHPELFALFLCFVHFFVWFSVNNEIVQNKSDQA